VHHIDGREENTAASNLEWCCKSCNAAMGAAYKKLGIGRRVKQYNPEGAKTVSQWVAAVTSVCPRDGRYGPARGCARAGSVMPVDEAVAVIRATPQAARRRFAGLIAGAKKGRGSKRSRSAVPF
jgi:hypothetical protein